VFAGVFRCRCLGGFSCSGRGLLEESFGAQKWEAAATVFIAGTTEVVMNTGVVPLWKGARVASFDPVSVFGGHGDGDGDGDGVAFL
jgi:hypothetical protein